MKMATPITTANSNFLYDACKFNGLFVNEKTAEKTKNTAKTVNIESDKF